MNTIALIGAFTLGFVTPLVIAAATHWLHHWRRELRYRKWQREYDEIYARHRHPSNREDRP
jgi:hypothetical protein